MAGMGEHLQQWPQQDGALLLPLPPSWLLGPYCSTGGVVVQLFLS